MSNLVEKYILVKDAGGNIIENGHLTIVFWAEPEKPQVKFQYKGPDQLYKIPEDFVLNPLSLYNIILNIPGMSPLMLNMHYVQFDSENIEIIFTMLNRPEDISKRALNPEFKDYSTPDDQKSFDPNNYDYRYFSGSEVEVMVIDKLINIASIEWSVQYLKSPLYSYNRKNMSGVMLGNYIINGALSVNIDTNSDSNKYLTFFEDKFEDYLETMHIRYITPTKEILYYTLYDLYFSAGSHGMVPDASPSILNFEFIARTISYSPKIIDISNTDI